MSSLKSASFLTLGIIFSFVFSVVAAVNLFLDNWSLPFALFWTIVVSFLSWLISPVISDLIYKWFYKVKFHSKEEISQLYPELSVFVESVTSSYGFRFPKIGIIDDGNPTAFTYGSTRNRARVVFTTGLAHYLNGEELKAVIAHELGHIKNNDFVVMTIAATMLQILYEIYAFLSKSKSNDNKKGALAAIGLISYVFYIIGSYLVLYLSRVREYYADLFSAQVTKSPELLSQALIKIAYGLVQVEDTAKSTKLLGSTRALGISDFKTSKSIGALVASQVSPQIIAEVMAFDICSPWAKIMELSSTHPLTGKRILALEKLTLQYGKSNYLNLETIIQGLNIDKDRLNKKFAGEVVLYFMPYVVPVLAFILIGWEAAVILWGVTSLIKLYYKMSNGEVKVSTVIEEMKNVYASPMKGKLIQLQGQIIGKGMSGYVFSEDVMLQDSTGLSYLDYNSAFGGIGNLFFSLKKVKQLIGQQVTAEGWFFRGVGQAVVLKQIATQDKKIKSHPRLWMTISIIVIMIFVLAL